MNNTLEDLISAMSDDWEVHPSISNLWLVGADWRQTKKYDEDGIHRRYNGFDGPTWSGLGNLDHDCRGTLVMCFDNKKAIFGLKYYHMGSSDNGQTDRYTEKFWDLYNFDPDEVKSTVDAIEALIAL